jgi:hypothetical protein
MRKHNKKFATRVSRTHGDTSNFPQKLSHNITNDKSFQLAANALLRGMLGSL